MHYEYKASGKAQRLIQRSGYICMRFHAAGVEDVPRLEDALLPMHSLASAALHCAGGTERFAPLLQLPVGLSFTPLPSISCHQKPPKDRTFFTSWYMLSRYAAVWATILAGDAPVSAI